MNKILITQIEISERQRREYRNIERLAESFLRIGQIQPIVLNGNRLIAGGRRIKAAQHLGWSDIAAVQMTDLTPAQRAEAELEENTQREDITWQERCLAIASIHSLKVLDSISEGDSWGVRETSELVGFNICTISYTIRIAKEIKLHPDGPVAKAENYQRAIEAMVAASEKESRDELDRRRAMVNEEPVAAPLEVDGVINMPPDIDAPVKIYLSNSAFNATFLDAISNYPADYFYAVLLTQPDESALHAIASVLRPDGFVVCWNSTPTFIAVAALCGLECQPNPIIWNDLDTMSDDNWPFPRSFVMGNVFRKTECQPPAHEVSSIISANNPGYFPLPVVEFSLRSITPPGRSVVLPHAASVLEVAKLGYKPIFFEPDKVKFDTIVEQLKEYYRSTISNVEFV